MGMHTGETPQGSMTMTILLEGVDLDGIYLGMAEAVATEEPWTFDISIVALMWLLMWQPVPAEA